MGRPAIPIDGEQVRKLAAMFCSDEDIATFVGASETTIKRRFARQLVEGRAHGKASLKRKQYQLAVDSGNVTMLIWLGKQYLGQSDKVEQRITSDPGRRPVEKLTDEELKAELAKHAGASPHGTPGGVLPATGADAPA